MINYKRDFLIDIKLKDIVERLNFNHIDTSRTISIRSHGSKSRGVIARCHTMPKIMQKALSIQPHYIIEIVSENFDRLGDEDKLRVLIHELMHIPHTFGGGFRHHKPYVNRKTVERMYDEYKRKT